MMIKMRIMFFFRFCLAVCWQLHHRAVLHTGATPGAEIHVNTSGALLDFNLEIAGFAFDRFKICVCDEFDVQMPADLDQYGRDNSHRAVIGGERLVELRHDAAD